ncbi:hypothetical protein ASC95_26510 [Pelomonas sp. Root1217]|uniref:type II secretion system protein GspK n=1 Tax=Pelomonas sp. Root1217 TaxID=1736430 RepID=UPI0007135505|nr:type II secretion system protein GspK [Pelomonas sp. Root1217]KQV47060.1 hypothetical protein ASC95_26510 [Pelomonas sp. Root1217]
MLVTVIGALAVVAFVALRFAERIDTLRRTAVDFDEYVAARANVAGARAATQYWLATRPLALGGRGNATVVVREDDRPFRFPDGAVVQVQDARGLLSLNSGDRQVLFNLLIADGLEPARAQAMIDVLDDYTDADDLRRLNGAERSEYAALGLPPPRNDWLFSLRELEALPLWRDDRERLARLSRSLSASLLYQFNPLTASPEVLRAMFPRASAAQLELLMTLRASELLNSTSAVTQLTGLALDGEHIHFAPGWESRLTLWAPGLPRALEYNIRLTPAGPSGPWVILEQHSMPRPRSPHDLSAAPLFPLSRAAGAQPAPHASAVIP